MALMPRSPQAAAVVADSLAAPAAAQPVEASATRRTRLWLCLHDPDLQGMQHDRLLQQLFAFTPVVARDPDGDALLLEVAGSLRLFGGLGRLCARIQALPAYAHASLAVAPTARAALWLARAGDCRPVRDPAQLPAALSRLAVAVTGWPQAALSLLSGTGIRTLGECLRLPRHGLARRIGRRCLLELDQALGHATWLPEPQRPCWRFHESSELPDAAADGSLLLPAAMRLLDRLVSGLRKRHAAVEVLWWRLCQPGGADERVRIALACPGQDRALLGELVALRFSTLRLAAPVQVLELLAQPVPLAPAAGTDLLGDLPETGGPRAALLQRLSARFGADAVHGLASQPHWQPEAAWQAVGLAPGRRVPSAPPAPAGPQPLWLLPEPRRLSAAPGSGGLRLGHGPRRLETGWWAGENVRRDYYAAIAPDGRRLWVFQDLRDTHWYLHGLFG
ncbi:MAG: hypothetical protein JJT85_12755 [Chromatiales bacterium]|nr:hypothetical protein [Chromatiales bacterium]